MITKIKTLLENKKIQTILSIKEETTVIEALEILAQHGVGALLVMDGEELKGIFSERDYARKGIIQGRKAKSTTIKEVMTPNVITVRIDQTTKECMEIMEEKNIRHLPVISNENKVVGFLSMKDIVRSMIQEQKQHIQFLESYISGGNNTMS